jgi:hypothetical protein
MHLFDTSDPGVVAARTNFYITLIILAVSTYAAAGLAYWLVRNRKQDQPEVEERVMGKGFDEDGNLNRVKDYYGPANKFKDLNGPAYRCLNATDFFLGISDTTDTLLYHGLLHLNVQVFQRLMIMP